MYLDFEEFIVQATEDDYVEWFDGWIVCLGTVTSAHRSLSGYLMRLISFFAEERAPGEVFHSRFLIRLGAVPSARVPDIMYIRNDRRDRIRQYYVDGPADLVVEVVSQESVQRDRIEKYFEYQQAGVKEYWLIDPIRRRADFYLRGDDELYHAGAIIDGVYRSEVLKGLWLRVDWLWQERLPSVLEVIKEWGLV